MKPVARAVAFAAMAASLCALPVLADDSAPAPKSVTNGLRVVVDPETGQVRAPTDAELKGQLQRENAASARGVARANARATTSSKQVLPAEKVVQRHSNGMLSVKLPQESLSMLKATPQADGKIKIEHRDEVSEHVAAEEK